MGWLKKAFNQVSHAVHKYDPVFRTDSKIIELTSSGLVKASGGKDPIANYAYKANEGGGYQKGQIEKQRYGAAIIAGTIFGVGAVGAASAGEAGAVAGAGEAGAVAAGSEVGSSLYTGYGMSTAGGGVSTSGTIGTALSGSGTTLAGVEGGTFASTLASTANYAKQAVSAAATIKTADALLNPKEAPKGAAPRVQTGAAPGVSFVPFEVEKEGTDSMIIQPEKSTANMFPFVLLAIAGGLVYSLRK